MEEKIYTYKRVGYFKEKTAMIIGVKFSGTIYASNKVIKHIKKRHGRHLNKKIINNLIEYMRKIIDAPNYIGVYKSTDKVINIELIKKFNEYILMGIEIDDGKDYINVSTMYPITERKIYSKLYKGKIKKCG